MKIYVAGKWSESKGVKKVMEMLESRGHIITLDWTGHVHPDKSKEYAIEDIKGVRECDVLVACMWTPDIFYKGCWVEIGAALALDKKVVIIGHEVSSVFLGHPNVHVFNFKEEALDFIDLIQCTIYMLCGSTDIDYNKRTQDTDHYIMGL